jgi:hypothetical protein
MIRGQPVVGSSQEAPIAVPEPRRERVVVRRRRAHSKHRTSKHGTGRWSSRAARRKVIRTAVVCVAVLVLMAMGVYFGLSRQEVAPAESRLQGPMLALS